MTLHGRTASNTRERVLSPVRPNPAPRLDTNLPLAVKRRIAIRIAVPVTMTYALTEYREAERFLPRDPTDDTIQEVFGPVQQANSHTAVCCSAVVRSIKGNLSGGYERR